MRSGAPLLLGYGIAICVIAGTAVALRSSEGGRAESPLPSVENADARGAKALFTYLAESGGRPGVLREPFTRLPGDAKVVVSLAPTHRPISMEEWRATGDWVRRGGTFVYAVPRRVRTQSVETDLSLRWVFGPRPAPLLDTDRLDQGVRALLEKAPERDDPTGADAIPWLPSPLLAGVRTLRVAADEGLETDVAAARLVAGAADSPAVLSFSFGKGEVLALAGSDLAENRRVALGDNLVFWANLAARGRVYFDEYHHQELRETGPGLLAAVGPTALQLLLGAALLALAFGRRLGEPRPLDPAQRRSAGEYVAQLARLYGSAGLDGELCAELQRSLRRTLFERLGLSATLDDLEVARRLEQRTGVSAERYLALARRAQALSSGASPQEYARLSREYALLERELGA